MRFIGESSKNAPLYAQVTDVVTLVTSFPAQSARIVSRPRRHYGPGSGRNKNVKRTFWVWTAGEPVPQVDASDMKAVLEIGQDMERRHPGGQVAIGREPYGNACKPGAIIQAELFRASRVDLLRLVAPAVLDPLIQDKLDAVCTIAAQIPMQWAGELSITGGHLIPMTFCAGCAKPPR